MNFLPVLGLTLLVTVDEQVASTAPLEILPFVGFLCDILSIFSFIIVAFMSGWETLFREERYFRIFLFYKSLVEVNQAMA